jgi:hypothetical protein
LPLFGTGHAQQPQAASPQRGGTLVIPLAPEPQIITAAFLTTMQVTMIAGKISEGLVWFDDKLQPQPELAAQGRLWRGHSCRASPRSSSQASSRGAARAARTRWVTRFSGGT